MKTLLSLSLGLLLSFGLLAQDSQPLKGPKAKNAKAWNNQTIKTPTIDLNKKKIDLKTNFTNMRKDNNTENNICALNESLSNSIYNNITNIDIKSNNNSNKKLINDNKSNQIYEANSIILSCVICYENENKQFLLSKCGHILCNECWNRTLTIKLECPLCKAKVRHKTLRKIFNN